MQAIRIALFCVCVSSIVLATNFRYAKIDVPNGTNTLALGINARGDVVGQYDDKNGLSLGFLLRKGVFLTIDFPSALFTLAWDINPRGDIVGTSTDAPAVDQWTP